MNWHEAAAKIRWDVRPFIDGRYRASSADTMFAKVNPATESVLYQMPEGNAADVDEAVKVARVRFNDGCWSKLPPSRRIDVLLKLADLIKARGAELALLDAMEIGKPIRAALDDVEILTPWLLRNWAGFADKLYGNSAPVTSAGVLFNYYEPRGVVAGIVPWNFPAMNSIFKIAPALAAGNSLVLKPSELSSASALRIAELAIEAGVPEGVLNVVSGVGGIVGAAIALHQDIDMLSFTGSTATGRAIMELCGRSNGKRLILECGGKSPQIVFPDVRNLETVAAAVAQSFLWNSGQVCSSHTRLIVHDDIASSLIELVIEKARKFRPADPLLETTDFGPLASPGQRDRVRRFVEQGIEAGAKPVLKGTVQESAGCYVSPTIFDNVTSEMSIAREEIFGPVLCASSFQTEDQAISFANCTNYGLAATVWTNDIGRARRLSQEIRAGYISIRTGGEEGPSSGYHLSHEPQKASGFGAEVGIGGLQSYSSLKIVAISGS